MACDSQIRTVSGPHVETIAPFKLQVVGAGDREVLEDDRKVRCFAREKHWVERSASSPGEEATELRQRLDGNPPAPLSLNDVACAVGRRPRLSTNRSSRSSARASAIWPRMSWSLSNKSRRSVFQLLRFHFERIRIGPAILPRLIPRHFQAVSAFQIAFQHARAQGAQLRNDVLAYHPQCFGCATRNQHTLSARVNAQ